MKQYVIISLIWRQNDLMRCPRCNHKLSKASQLGTFFWVCPSCNGRTVSLDVVRKAVPIPVSKEIWQQVITKQQPSDIKCPVCTRKMTVVSENSGNSPNNIDVCKSCRFIWFDPGEFEHIPKNIPAKPGPSIKDLPPDLREAIAIDRLNMLREERELDDIGQSSPDNWRELVIGFFGAPVEYNNKSIANIPIATWVLSAIMVLSTVLLYANLADVVNSWGLLPGEFARHYGLTFITSFFLHGGIIHLLGNLYFLLIFGDNVEDFLGKTKYLLLIALSAFAGDILHIVADPRSQVPSIGASGGIAGVLVYYCLQFPKAKVGLLMWFRWIRIPVGWMLAFWVAGQILGTIQQLSGFGNVSSLAHLGGAIVGGLFWWVGKGNERKVSQL
jgi:membrane associated rhomboid family serine protease/Zn-finger nucleic acid-binding protein